MPLPRPRERITMAIGRTREQEANSSIRKLGFLLASQCIPPLELPSPRGQWARKPAYVCRWILSLCLQPSDRYSTENFGCAHSQAVALSGRWVLRKSLSRNCKRSVCIRNLQDAWQGVPSRGCSEESVLDGLGCMGNWLFCGDKWEHRWGEANALYFLNSVPKAASSMREKC